MQDLVLRLIGMEYDLYQKRIVRIQILDGIEKASFFTRNSEEEM